MDKYLKANAELSKFCRNYMDLKKDLPIRPSEMGVLNIIAETPGPHTSVMLTELLGVSKPMIAAHLSVLMKKGYITKQQSPDDKRVFFIKPTEKALDLVAYAKKELNGQLELLIQKLGQKEFDALVDYITEANQILEADRKEKTEE
ncbi:MAG: winged helix-turn-helix transcriptional regulator [Lachnospiraceae bacterium]|nr:winged helix-turn-helix transcriptional regulator [Lachnospiraceae bacterium]